MLNFQHSGQTVDRQTDRLKISEKCLRQDSDQSDLFVIKMTLMIFTAYIFQDHLLNDETFFFYLVTLFQ